jgi:uncharacterized protein
MMNSLPRRVRVCAALCHLSGLIWPLGVSLTITANWQGSIFGLSLAVPILTWLSTRRVHDFVDRAGREAVNAQLSLSLYGACAAFITAMACGMNANMHTATALGVWAVVIFMFLAPCVGLIYTIIAIVATVEALRGNVLRYPLIIRFIPDP